jgi:hypothetical protein
MMIFKLVILACLTQPTANGYTKQCAWEGQGVFPTYVQCAEAGETLMLANPQAKPGEKREDWNCERARHR